MDTSAAKKLIIIKNINVKGKIVKTAKNISMYSAELLLLYSTKYMLGGLYS